MKKYFTSLLLGLTLIALAITYFGQSVYIAPLLITLGLALIVVSLVKLSKIYPGIKDFFKGLLENF